MNHFSFIPTANLDPTFLATERYSMECLLNCFLRDYAWPHRKASLSPSPNHVPPLLRGNTPDVLHLKLAAGNAFCGVERVSKLGRCHINSPVFLQRTSHPHWEVLPLITLARSLSETISPHEHNDEFLEQIQNNFFNIISFMKHLPQHHSVPDIDTLITSEQGLVWGHSLHPTPKSRQGVTQEALLYASPETRTHFPLFWFRIAPHLLKTLGEEHNHVLHFLAEQNNLYPCHPWEAEQILQNSTFQKAYKDGAIEPIGLQGKSVFPTSSVRTLCHPELDEHLKFSVHVRMTNCVRKNAWYELESAVLLTQLLQPHLRTLAQDVPGFSILEEPAATTLDFSSYGHDATIRHLTESFGILYRKGIPTTERRTTFPHVALALFSPTPSPERHPYCLSILKSLSRSQNLTLHQAVRRWITRYADILVGGILHAHIIHGIITEPHLQNVIVGIDEHGLPCRIWIRDMEGTKLSRSHWEETLATLTSPEVSQSLLYDDEKSQYRTQYCLLVNHLAEALFHLSWAADIDEHILWADLEAIMHQHHQHLTLRGYKTDWLAAILAGKPLLAKGNLLTRLHQVADRHADVVAITSPFPVRNAA